MPPMIVINSKYSLTADSMQWIILHEGRMTKFFPKLENALNWLLRAKIKGSNIKSIEQLGFAIKRHSQTLQQLVTSSEFKEEVQNGRD